MKGKQWWDPLCNALKALELAKGGQGKLAADGSSREEKVTSTGADSDSDEPDPQRQDRREVAPLLSDRAGLGMKAEVAGDAYAAFRQDKSVVYHRFIRGSGRKKRAKR